MEMSERGGPLPSENSQTMQVVGKKAPGEREVPGSIYCLFSSWIRLLRVGGRGIQEEEKTGHCSETYHDGLFCSIKPTISKV